MDLAGSLRAALRVEEALSPEEEGAGILHWDTYMPYVLDEDWAQKARMFQTHHQQVADLLATLAGSLPVSNSLTSFPLTASTVRWNCWTKPLSTIV